MTPETLQALWGSIRKWEGIVKGVEIDEGGHNCPLCQEFNKQVRSVLDRSIRRGPDLCQGCPVREHTGRDCCEGTPYTKFSVVRDRKRRDKVDLLTGDGLAEAQAELEFLISLLPADIKEIYLSMTEEERRNVNFLDSTTAD